MPHYEKRCSDPWFSIIQLGLKDREGRFNVGDFAKMQKGDTILFTNDMFGFRREFAVEVTSTKTYPSFDAYLRGEGLEKCLPSIDTIEHGIAVYRKYFDEESERKFGVVSVRLRVLCDECKDKISQ